jgi:hypothetical protein
MGRSNQQQLRSALDCAPGVIAAPVPPRQIFGFGVSPDKVIPYEASGGSSERRAYKDEEGLTIESQKDGYVLAWSAETPARGFMEAVSKLVDASAATELLPRTNGRVSIPLAEAIAAVAKHPDTKVIEVTSDDESFVWTATDPSARSRHNLTRVAVAFSALDSARVEKFISDTAAPQIKDDLDGIIESAERLTHSTPTATA